MVLKIMRFMHFMHRLENSYQRLIQANHEGVTRQHTPRINPGACNSPHATRGTGTATLPEQTSCSDVGTADKSGQPPDQGLNLAPYQERGKQVELAYKRFRFVADPGMMHSLVDGASASITNSFSRSKRRVPLH